MREAFMSALANYVEDGRDFAFVTGDLGFGVVEAFRDQYPSRFVNVGVAEQAMIGVAAGLTIEYDRVFAYSIGSFASLRCLEQIRNDICYHNLNVCVTSVGAGTMYGTHGYSHYALEDIAALRALPNIRVFNPASEVELVNCLERIVDEPGPSYLRLGRATSADQHPRAKEFASIWSQERQGMDANIVVAGTLLSEVLMAADQLQGMGHSVGVFSCPQIKPIDPHLLGALGDSPVVTVEDHSVVGGLGSAFLEALSRGGSWRPVLSLGYERTAMSTVGREGFMRRQAGLDSVSLSSRISDWLGHLGANA